MTVYAAGSDDPDCHVPECPQPWAETFGVTGPCRFSWHTYDVGETLRLCMRHSRALRDSTIGEL